MVLSSTVNLKEVGKNTGRQIAGGIESTFEFVGELLTLGRKRKRDCETINSMPFIFLP